MIAKLNPLLGVSGEVAASRIENFPVRLTKDEAIGLSNLIKKDVRDRLNEDYVTATGASLDDIPVQARTVLISLAYSFGDYKTKIPTIWNAATMGRWDEVSKELRNTSWKQKNLIPRRMAEADLLDEIANQSTQLAANVDYDDDATKGIATLPDGTKMQTYKF